MSVITRDRTNVGKKPLFELFYNFQEKRFNLGEIGASNIEASELGTSWVGNSLLMEQNKVEFSRRVFLMDVT